MAIAFWSFEYEKAIRVWYRIEESLGNSIIISIVIGIFSIIINSRISIYQFYQDGRVVKRRDRESEGTA